MKPSGQPVVARPVYGKSRETMTVIVRERAQADLMRPRTGDILSAALPGLNLLDRTLLRAVAMAGRTRIGSISGIRNIAADRDPFILALNHNSRLEALFVPALLVLL